MTAGFRIGRRAALGLALPFVARAAAPGDAPWPSRPIRAVVPWPAGGPTDAFGRVVARELAPLLGQPLVIENRTGATGTVGVQHVAQAAPDGYTLLFANTTAFLGSVAALGDVVRFDPLRDFTAIGFFVETVTVLWTHPSLRIGSFDALLERARRGPPIAFGTTGSGSVSEQSVEQIARRFALDLTKVPYKGTAPQVTDLLAGHVQIGSADLATIGPAFRDGLVAPLLVIGRARLPELPAVPTSAEYGLTEPDFTIWNGMFAPAATPAPIVARLRAALEQAVQHEAVRAVTEGNGNRPIFQTGEAATQRLARDLAERRAYARQVDDRTG